MSKKKEIKKLKFVFDIVSGNTSEQDLKDTIKAAAAAGMVAILGIVYNKYFSKNKDK